MEKNDYVLSSDTIVILLRQSYPLNSQYIVASNIQC